MFVNDSDEPMTWVWMLMPNGLESFFRAIGHRFVAGEPNPTPFYRPTDVLDIEKRWGFAPPRVDSSHPSWK
jgi:hypothetical protein